MYGMERIATVCCFILILLFFFYCNATNRIFVDFLFDTKQARPQLRFILVLLHCFRIIGLTIINHIFAVVY